MHPTIPPYRLLFRGLHVTTFDQANQPFAPCHNDADVFVRRGLEHKVMTVPGRFFDVNPGQLREANPLYRHWVRFSFGPPEENVLMGLDRLQAMIG